MVDLMVDETEALLVDATVGLLAITGEYKSAVSRAVAKVAS